MDPRASLGPLAVTISIGGHRFEVQPQPAAVWLDVLLDPELTGSDGGRAGVPVTAISDAILASAIGPSAMSDLMMGVVLGQLEYADIDSAAQDLLTELAGRPWYQAINLCLMASASWAVVGASMILAGIRATEVSLSAWLDAAYLTAIRIIAEGKDAEQRIGQLRAEIEREPAAPGGDPDDMDAEEFMSAASAAVPSAL